MLLCLVNNRINLLSVMYPEKDRCQIFIAQ